MSLHKYLIAAAILSFGNMLHAAEINYPDRPIRVVVPFAPGGATDILVRIVGQKLNEQLPYPMVIDNRGGAGGAIGAEIVSKAPRDGYTIMATTSGVIVVNPSLYRRLNYDPAKDFSPITIIASLPNMLVVSPSSPANSVKDLLAMAKAKPGTLTFASGGNGTSNHLAGELLKYLAGVNLIHVPYKGGGPAVLATITGEVSMLFATMPSALQHVKSGKLKALAVTSAKRAEAVPNLPTMMESGLKDFEIAIWVGMLAPSGTSSAHIKRLNLEVAKALKSPQVIKGLGSKGYDIVGNSPEQMASTIKTESTMWARVIKGAGIQAN